MVNDADLAEAVAVFEVIGRVISFSILPRSIETGESDESSESDPEENPWRNHFRKHNQRSPSLSQAQRSPSLSQAQRLPSLSQAQE